MEMIQDHSLTSHTPQALHMHNSGQYILSLAVPGDAERLGTTSELMLDCDPNVAVQRPIIQLDSSTPQFCNTTVPIKVHCDCVHPPNGKYRQCLAIYVKPKTTPPQSRQSAGK